MVHPLPTCSPAVAIAVHTSGCLRCTVCPVMTILPGQLLRCPQLQPKNVLLQWQTTFARLATWATPCPCLARMCRPPLTWRIPCPCLVMTAITILWSMRWTWLRYRAAWHTCPCHTMLSGKGAALRPTLQVGDSLPSYQTFDCVLQSLGQGGSCASLDCISLFLACTTPW